MKHSGSFFSAGSMLCKYSIAICNKFVYVMFVCSTPTEIEWRYSEKGERVRVSKRTGRIIPIPAMADMCEDFVYPKSYKGMLLTSNLLKFLS